MRHFQTGLFAAGLSLALSGPALAELTVQQAREALFGLYDTMGYKVSIAAETESGGTLTLSGVTISFSPAGSAGNMVLDMGTITLSEISGSVEVTYPDSMQIRADFTPPDDDPVNLRLAMDFSEFGSLMSGTPEALRIETGATTMNVRIDSLLVGGRDIPLNVTVDGAEIEGDYTITRSAPDRLRIEGVSGIGALAFKGDMVKPGGGGAFNADATFTGLGFDFLTDTAAIDFTDPQEAMRLLEGDFAFGIEMTSESSAVNVDFADGADTLKINSSSTGGRFAYDLSKSGFGLDMTQTGVALTFSSSEIPFPAISLAYDEVAFGFDVPLAASGEPQDVDASMALRGLTVDEALWAMFDPGQTLPRDPVTVALALSGKVMVLVDLLDPETLMQLENMDAPPMLPVSASLDELLVSFGGAKLTGDGQATLDLATAKVVNGVPMPVGAVNLKLTGAFGLMDKLANMGLIPPDVSMMARGVIGAFAKPVGEDDFESTLEITEDGAILANGQPVQ